MEERLQKVLARAGLASRRKAEELITQGRVEVNGEKVTELGTKVDGKKDLIRVDGKLIEATKQDVHLVLYKPAGVVTTMSDPEGRRTIAELVKGYEERLFPVGRLDYDAEGALLVTNDGDLAHRLTHPKFGVRRTYLAKVKGRPDRSVMEKMLAGVKLEDGVAKPLEAMVQSLAEKNTWIRLVVDEGRPHLIKRLCEAVGYPVQRLYRPDYAGISVEGMEPGRWRELSPMEVKLLVAGGAKQTAPRIGLPARRHGRGPGGSAASLGVRSRARSGTSRSSPGKRR